MRILHLATDLGPTATGRRLSLLVPALTRRGIEQTVVVLNPHAVFSLSHSPLPVRPLLDIAGWRKLKRVVANYHPTLIHAWGRRAASLLNVLQPTCPMVKTFDGDESFLSRRVGQRLPVPTVAGPVSAYDRAAIRAQLDLVDSDRVIVACDRFEHAAAIKLAIGAMELIKYTSPTWRLVVLGDGPALAHAEHYAVRLLAEDNRIQFPGRVPGVSPILAAADAVWQTRRSGGAHFTAEALTRGLPVFAVPNADLSGMPVIAVNDGVELAARTRAHFDAPSPLPAVAFPIEPVVDMLMNTYAQQSSKAIK